MHASVPHVGDIAGKQLIRRRPIGALIVGDDAGLPQMTQAGEGPPTICYVLT